MYLPPIPFQKSHDDVLKSIRNLIEGLGEISESKWQLNFQFSYYKNHQNKKQPEYLLTKKGFTLLAVGFSGKKALRFKVAYIDKFEEMELFIKNLYETKIEFPEFTDAIMALHEEPKHYHFSNEVNMINSIVLGMTAKKFKEIHNLSGAKSIRPYLTNNQINAVKALQRVDIGLAYAGKSYNERKCILKQYFNQISLKQISA